MICPAAGGGLPLRNLQARCSFGAAHRPGCPRVPWKSRRSLPPRIATGTDGRRSGRRRASIGKRRSGTTFSKEAQVKSGRPPASGPLGRADLSAEGPSSVSSPVTRPSYLSDPNWKPTLPAKTPGYIPDERPAAVFTGRYQPDRSGPPRGN